MTHENRLYTEVDFAPLGGLHGVLTLLCEPAGCTPLLLMVSTQMQRNLFHPRVGPLQSAPSFCISLQRIVLLNLRYMSCSAPITVVSREAHTEGQAPVAQ